MNLHKTLDTTEFGQVDDHKLLRWNDNNDLTACAAGTISMDIYRASQELLLAYPPHIAISLASGRFGIRCGAFGDPIAGDHLFVEPPSVLHVKQTEPCHISCGKLERISRDNRFFAK